MFMGCAMNLATLARIEGSHKMSSPDGKGKREMLHRRKKGQSSLISSVI